MNRSIYFYSFILLVLLALILWIDSGKPKPINWDPTYTTTSKKPLDLYVLDKEFKALTGQEITKFKTTPFEFFETQFDYDTLVRTYKIKGNFLTIAEYGTLDATSSTEILNFVSHKNSAFISMKKFPENLLDSLNVKMDADYKFSNKLNNWIANPKLGNQKYQLIEGIGNDYFTKFDTLNTTVLGYQSGDSTRVNYIKVLYKNGTVFLHTQPAAFSNFHLLEDDHHHYAEKVLSCLPKVPIYWFINDGNTSEEAKSILDFILKNPSLRSAWFLFLIGMLVFMIFNAKRKQRIVPIIKPLENTTVEFAKTIGNLYYQEGDHTTIIDKKIIYFLEKIRNEYLIDTRVMNPEFIKKLHQKSGKDLVSIERAVLLINTHRRSPHSSIEEDLLQINAAIEKIISSK